MRCVSVRFRSVSLALTMAAATLAVAPGAQAAASGAPRWALRSTVMSWSPAAVRAAVCRPTAKTSLTIPLFDGATATATGGDLRVGQGGSVSWEAEIAGDAKGSADIDVTGLCAGAATDPVFTAALTTRGHEYTVGWAGSDEVTLSELNPAWSLPADDGTSGAPPAAAVERSLTARTAAHLRSAVRTQDYPDCHGAADVATIDLAMIFSDGAAAHVGGQPGMDAAAMLGADLTNQGFINSLVPARVRIVFDGAAAALAPGFPGEAAPPNGTGASLDDYQRWASTNGLWTRLAADDLVFMTTTQAGQGYANYGFAVAPNQAMFWMGADLFGDYVLGHELGHNLGLAHDWATEPSSTAVPESHGWVAPDLSWNTIMAYPSACGGCARLNYYSDATRFYQGQPLGAPVGSARPSDQVPILRQTAPVIAGYQPEQTPAVYCRLSVVSNPVAGGVTAPEIAGPYNPGTSVDATASASNGYRLTGWSLDGQVLPGGASPTTRILSTRDSVLAAHYAPVDCPGAVPCRLLITKSSSPAAGPVKPGNAVTYTITIHNPNTITYTGATFDDDLSGILDTSTLTAGPTASLPGGIVTLNGTTLSFMGDIPAGATATITYTVTVR